MNALETLLGHRTIREYSNKPISDDLLTKILEAAVRGSTTGNMQLYSIIINKDEEMKRRYYLFISIKSRNRSTGGVDLFMPI